MRRKTLRYTRFWPDRAPKSLAVVVGRIPLEFRTLGLSATIFDAEGYHALNTEDTVSRFEILHGREVQRYAYNQRSTAEAVATKTTVLGQHAGFSDLFVPIIEGGRVTRILVVGPFRTAPFTSGEIQECWQRLTGRRGHLSDPVFSEYVSMALGTTLFDRPSLDAFKRFVVTCARVLASEGDNEALSAELDLRNTKLSELTFARLMWDAARSLVSQSGIWASHYRNNDRRALGANKMPERVLVLLFASQAEEADALDALVRRHDFQRTCFRVARQRGETLCAPEGDRGVTFLCASERSETATRAALRELGERLTNLARRQFQLGTHAGVVMAPGRQSLTARYQAALSLAERALAQGTRLLISDTLPESGESLRELRSLLRRLANATPGELRPRFERYLAAVAIHAGYLPEQARPHLEAGLERVAEPLLASGTLDERTLAAIQASLERGLAGKLSLDALFAGYRRALGEIEDELASPRRAHRERNLRRAVTFIRDHATERLDLGSVAHIAGFAPKYFSRVFRQRERMTFERYVTELRLEHSKQLLKRSSLAVDRVARLSGFSTSAYFCRVFRHHVGETPLEYRARPS